MNDKSNIQMNAILFTMHSNMYITCTCTYAKYNTENESAEQRAVNVPKRIFLIYI